MFGAHGGAAIVGKAGYILSCILAALVLVTSGFAYYVKAQVAEHRRLGRHLGRPVRRRDEHPADGPGEPHRL